MENLWKFRVVLDGSRFLLNVFFFRVSGGGGGGGSYNGFNVLINIYMCIYLYLHTHKQNDMYIYIYGQFIARQALLRWWFRIRDSPSQNA